MNIIKKKVQCVDCGEWFEVDNKNTKTVRCGFCQEEKNKENGRKRNITPMPAARKKRKKK